ncbi:MAG: DUF1990 domain-containing protein [Magnetococcales bacterium]|nr:DUF1990 domain-containing protein [Magnetococcales bacterium]
MIRNPNKAMFSLLKPSTYKIEAFIRSQQGEPFTYPEVGCTRDGPLPLDHPLSKQYRLVNHRFSLGEGEATFERAKKAFRRWGMFSLDWVKIHPPNTSMDVGSLIGIVSHVMGVWSINVCRVIYRLDEENGPVARFGIGYGTLPGHAIRGEERMVVEWDRERDEVFFEMVSFSVESQLIAKVSSFHLRALQDRFARESARQMRHFARC